MSATTTRNDPLESVILGTCSCCGDEVSIVPDNHDPICWTCLLLDIRTPAEHRMTLTMSLAEWDAYRVNRPAS